jgi:Ca2+-binding EF-hand superfamily protein
MYVTNFFFRVDLDGDGLISYDEYMFFQTLLAIPRRRLALAFSIIDQDGSGSVDRTEFEAIMAVLRRSTQAGQAEYSRLGQGSVGCDALFGDSYTISLEHFLAFHDSLSEEVLRLQFAASDSDGSGELSAQEFALFLASKVNVDRSLQRQYIELARAPQVTLLKGSISLDDFLAFHDFLHYLDQLEVAAMVLGTPVGLNKDEFLRAAAAAVGGDEGRGSVKPGISPIIVDVLFALFDVDGNGRLSRDEFITIMRKQSSSVDPPRTLPLLSVLRRVRDCVLEQAPTLLKV